MTHALLAALARVASWLTKPPDFEACRFANETQEDDS